MALVLSLLATLEFKPQLTDWFFGFPWCSNRGKVRYVSNKRGANVEHNERELSGGVFAMANDILGDEDCKAPGLEVGLSRSLGDALQSSVFQ